MADSLHILNGDSTLQLFKQTTIEGETFVWREVLAEGPVHSDFNSEDFWNQRRAFITQSFDTTVEQYNQDVYLPFKKLSSQLSQYSEIVLWFEYDLFCQINMMALIQYLGEKREPGQQISLVCSGKIDDSEKLYGLGELSPKQLADQLQQKLKLNTREFEFAKDVYQAYCSANPNNLFTYTIMPSDEFPYLSDALNAHFRRFPNSISGLSEIEQTIVDLATEGVNNHHKLIGRMLRWQKYYGFGDLQYFNTLNSLKGLFSDYEKLKIKTEPELSSAIQNLDRNMILGGASLAEWQFDPTSEELIPSASA
ncbi:DUF1835 domain-containing protein [Roseivirga spongicola]|uniref:DUF1835 domain-containing protein n=1 Tax=Roseivirga spongicola TaxID=333140 RepID=A0A150XEN1_9BACT|nr:DUF1835 domain-containing protein [Roseivirga spongicola]KYG77209.1 hypothetical protein AWW68_00115 [Roseivirga spongicola]WPZ10908.1 DUF1835 domain-containing protein [Roseivirga spongicola]